MSPLSGTLPAAMHGNPWLRLLRREVEELARNLHGERDLRERQARTELARINRELKQLRATTGRQRSEEHPRPGAQGEAKRPWNRRKTTAQGGSRC
jgi:hypothetical protein